MPFCVNLPFPVTYGTFVHRIPIVACVLIIIQKLKKRLMKKKFIQFCTCYNYKIQKIQQFFQILIIVLLISWSIFFWSSLSSSCLFAVSIYRNDTVKKKINSVSIIINVHEYHNFKDILIIFYAHPHLRYVSLILYFEVFVLGSELIFEEEKKD